MPSSTRRRPTRSSGQLRSSRPRGPFDARQHSLRLRIARLGLAVALLAAGVKLVQVQTVEAAALSEQSLRQREVSQRIHAERGAIYDREGNPLALSGEARMLTASPNQIESDREELGEDPAEYKRNMASFIKEVLGDAVDEETLREALFRDARFTYLTSKPIEPSKADEITAEYPEIATEYRATRTYPGGHLASNILGFANWRLDQDEPRVLGMAHLENSENTLLAGRDGERILSLDRARNITIPGSTRVIEEATPGSSLALTLDSDLQYVLQDELASYVAETGAESGSAVVLDARTAEVYALANDVSFDPNDTSGATREEMGNPAVTHAFEPGSVAKVVAAAGAIEDGHLRPDSVLDVPGSIQVADRVIRDAWSHNVERMTLTGVLARSSNVGTLMVADQLGRERFAEMLGRFGLGERTGVGLPGESAGYVPPLGQWSGSTFGNLPIGQGLSVTVLQMAGMYQAIANDGVRVPPRIIQAEISPEGDRIDRPRPEGVRVVSPETARTVRDMLRAVVQDAPGQRGTGTAAALPGYQIAGKTGTAQQIDPECGCYSRQDHWITFAGMVPAEDPQFVVAVMLNRLGTEHSSSSAALFREIASYLTQRYEIPLSEESSPVVELTLR
ncbi:peptidoglycan D,D-transpeptidase FtsI family protein [Actinoalloteichus spitiensis]|uniref:peptidoglycan D,D-transpeptidase FtsI family protein n=1 Tax=Actinoalloteichus spitiensis TaxID=252394 RepID=UPI00036D4AA7|nr:penicillin-binding protein 2 [Actinoalloteichus spitiensis]